MTIRDLLYSILDFILSIVGPLVIYPYVVLTKILNGDFLEIRIVELFATLVSLAIVGILYVFIVIIWFEEFKERMKKDKEYRESVISMILNLLFFFILLVFLYFVVVVIVPQIVLQESG